MNERAVSGPRRYGAPATAALPPKSNARTAVPPGHHLRLMVVEAAYEALPITVTPPLAWSIFRRTCWPILLYAMVS